MPGQELDQPAADEGGFLVLRTDQNELQQILADNIGGDKLTEFDLDRVKVPTGGNTSWGIPGLEGVQVADAIEGIIVHWANRRAYWPGDFKGSEPPVCSSPDGVWGYGDPGDKLRAMDPPQGCDHCPNAAFGSDKNQRGQACKAMRQLFVLPRDSIIPIVVTVPPASLQNARKYFLRLVRGNVHYASVITKMTLTGERNPDGVEYARVDFSAVEKLEADDVVKIRSYADKLAPAFAAVTVDARDIEGGAVDEATT